MFLIRLDAVSLAFGSRKLLREADLSIEPAERVCLVGRNGAGKTSVLRLVTGTQEPDDGEVRRQGDLCITELEQVLPGDEEQKVGDFVAEGLADIIRMTQQYREQAGADLDSIWPQQRFKICIAISMHMGAGIPSSRSKAYARRWVWTLANP